MAVEAGNPFKKTWKYTRENGLRDTLRRAVSAISATAFQRLVHSRVQPSLLAMWTASQASYTSAHDLLENHFCDSGEELRRFEEEFEVLDAELTRRYASLSLRYPRHWGVESASSFLLYTMVRKARPGVMLETGVANGHSTFFCLKAMEANRHGMLCSVDVDPGAGVLIAASERDRWDFRVLQGAGIPQALAGIAKSIAPIDIFLHDSDHWYDWTRRELDLARKHASADAIVAADDADYSWAFLDWCRSAGCDPILLVEARKVLGLTFLGQSPRRKSAEAPHRESGARLHC